MHFACSQNWRVKLISGGIRRLNRLKAMVSAKRWGRTVTGLPAGNDERGGRQDPDGVPAVTDIKNPIHAAAELAHNAARTNSRALLSRGVQELYRAPA